MHSLFLGARITNPRERAFNLDYIKQLKHIKQTAVNGVKSLKEELYKSL